MISVAWCKVSFEEDSKQHFPKRWRCVRYGNTLPLHFGVAHCNHVAEDCSGAGRVRIEYPMHITDTELSGGDVLCA